MVLDKIENHALYQGLSERIARAFQYLNEADLHEISVGKHEIDHDNIFALVQEYETKDIQGAKHERHQKYIDLQYIINGV